VREKLTSAATAAEEQCPADKVLFKTVVSMIAPDGLLDDVDMFERLEPLLNSFLVEWPPMR
jgi:hypothetical protein